MNVIIEPTDNEEGSYTIPAYTYLKSNSQCVHIGLHNMSCHTVTLPKGTVVAELSPANVILRRSQRQRRDVSKVTGTKIMF